MGISILSGPNAVLFVASTRLGNIIPGLLTGSRGGSTAVAFTAGSLCYFSVPLVLFDQPVTSIFSVLMIIAVLFSGYLFGLGGRQGPENSGGICYLVTIHFCWCWTWYLYTKYQNYVFDGFICYFCDLV